MPAVAVVSTAYRISEIRVRLTFARTRRSSVTARAVGSGRRQLVLHRIGPASISRRLVLYHRIDDRALHCRDLHLDDDVHRLHGPAPAPIEASLNRPLPDPAVERRHARDRWHPERSTLEDAAAGAAKVLGHDHGVTKALAKQTAGMEVVSSVAR